MLWIPIDPADWRDWADQVRDAGYCSFIAQAEMSPETPIFIGPNQGCCYDSDIITRGTFGCTAFQPKPEAMGE